MNTFVKNNSLLISNKDQRTVLEYQSGIVAAGGISGASDPATQGWTYEGTGSAYSDGYDSGNGGWRLVDGTVAAPSQYYTNLTSDQIYDLNNKDWRIDYKIALDKDAITSTGTTVTDYYLAPNNSRQSNVGVVLRTANSLHYWVVCTLDGSNQIQITNWYNALEKYNTGYYLGGANPFPQFLDFSLRYRKTTNIASAYVGETYLGDISEGPNSTQNRFYFSSGTSSGQGSGIWNFMTVKVY